MRIPVYLLALMLALVGAPARADEAPGDEPEAPGLVDFPIGEFLVKDYLPVQGSKTRLNFVAHAGVKEENAGDFEGLLDKHKNRVRAEVLTAARLTAPEEFQDPDLRRVRRRILLRVRHALPGLPIDDVFFSEFQYFVE